MIGCGTDTSNVNPTPSAVLRIEDSLDVRLIGSTVETLEIAGGLGVVLDNSQLSFEGDVHVRDSRTSGVRVGGVTGSGLRLTGTGNEIIDNCRFGVRVARGSLGDFRGNALIGRNRRFGLSAFESGRLNLTEQAVVEDNHIGGLLGRFGAFITVFGEATIRGNGGMANPNDFFFRFTSGIIADFGSTLLIRGSNPNVGVMIVDNDVPALLLDNNSTAELENVTATGNNDGMIIEHQSVAQFLANVKLENNGQNDLDCDQSSLFHGDLTGVKNDRCSRTPKSK